MRTINQNTTTEQGNPTLAEAIMYLVNLEMKHNKWSFEYALRIVRRKLEERGQLK